jgi:putative flippase GtrA
MNHRLVFQSQASVGKSLVRYYALAIPQLIVQFLLTQGVFTLLNIADSQTLLRGLIYGLVMCVLFIVSFVIQQRWVFAGKASSKNK